MKLMGNISKKIETLSGQVSPRAGGSKDYEVLTNKPKINNVELVGNKTTEDLNISYNDLKNKPSIPSPQVNADWNATSGVAEILNKPTIKNYELNYSTNEVDTGITWIDGKHIFQKSWSNIDVTVQQYQWVDTGIIISDASKVIKSMALADHSEISIIVDIRPNEGGKVYVMGLRNTTPTIKEFVLEYIK